MGERKCDGIVFEKGMCVVARETEDRERDKRELGSEK
jgi:hypothetical protein